MDPHVAIPRCDEGVARPEAVAILRLLDPDGTEPVTPLGEGPRELFGHVLDDGEPRRVGRHRHEERLNRLGATGRRPHGDHALGGPRPPGRGRVRLSPKRHGYRRKARPGGGLHRVEHLGDDVRHPSHQLPRGHLHDVHGPELEGQHGHLARLPRRRGHEHDRRPRGVDHPFQGGQAPPRQDRHVEGDHVGPEPRHRLARVGHARYGGDDLDLAVRRENGRENPTRHGRALDDEDANGPCHDSKSTTSPNRGGACASARRCACSSVLSRRRPPSRSRRT